MEGTCQPECSECWNIGRTDRLALPDTALSRDMVRGRALPEVGRSLTLGGRSQRRSARSLGVREYWYGDGRGIAANGITSEMDASL